MSWRTCAAFLCAVTCAFGCGGGSPLLHGAHVLPPRTTSWGAGVSAAFAMGGASDAVQAARAAATIPTAPPSTQRDAILVRGAAVNATIAPAVAPWASGRVGLENQFEAGLTYTGRSLRVDGRRAFESGRLALSTGLGGSVVLGGPSEDTSGLSTYVELGRPRGWGVDLPVLVGWQDKTDIVTLWTGPRAGFEKLAATATFPLETPARTGDLSATRWYVGPVVGLAVGFRHVHAAAEVSAYYQSMHAAGLGIATTVRGVSLVPAAALKVSF